MSELTNFSPVAADQPRRSIARASAAPAVQSNREESIPATPPAARRARESMSSFVSFADADDVRSIAPPQHTEVLSSDRWKRQPRTPITPPVETPAREHRSTIAVDASPKPPRQILLRGVSNVSSSTASISSQRDGIASARPRMYS